MNNSITVSGLLLEASEDERTLTYRLLPYGEPGHTSLGWLQPLREAFHYLKSPQA